MKFKVRSSLRNQPPPLDSLADRKCSASIFRDRREGTPSVTLVGAGSRFCLSDGWPAVPLVSQAQCLSPALRLCSPPRCIHLPRCPWAEGLAGYRQRRRCWFGDCGESVCACAFVVFAWCRGRRCRRWSGCGGFAECRSAPGPEDSLLPEVLKNTEGDWFYPNNIKLPSSGNFIPIQWSGWLMNGTEFVEWKLACCYGCYTTWINK